MEIRPITLRKANEYINTHQNIVQRLADIRNNIVVADSELGGER